MTYQFNPHIIFYGALIFLGTLGNFLVLATILAIVLEDHSFPSSDILLTNLTIVNLLISIFWNIPEFILESGVEMLLPLSWCRLFMFIWVWLRCVSIWVTFLLSLFYFLKIKQHVRLSTKAREATFVSATLLAIWLVNFAYAIPALFYAKATSGNETVSLMIVSTTVKPFLGCVWNFPNAQAALAVSKSYLVIQEILPMLLMLGTNLSTVYYLQKHMRSIGVERLHSLQVERKAAKVIMALVTLFVLCWGTHLLAVNYYSYNRGSATSFILTLANYSASLFIGFSPLILAMGHGKLRGKICKILRIKLT
ncbi:olfactory receptor class A-like protein 4 [Callorhinchus milii]|uniref:olfactory receptor class A-like protein 4 n=1 Tax=Callorhinchus milii TaxID=7868 RepID=UPI0004574CF4|nr:olfactory receptor class A-like protein 4 [Callorhinchus milii]|eukprot:gi/632977110/ref/XP_007905163.1/ PREDICTED: vomeronasal type-1 receptor 2-like [Callorhinchus milii]